MNLFINATSLRSAGGRSVALNFLSALEQGDHDIGAVAYVPPNAGYQDALEGDDLEICMLPEYLDKSWLAPVVDQWWLPRRVRDHQPDVVFSMGNMAIPVPYPQLLLFHWPYAIYPESRVWDTMPTQDLFVRRLRLWYFRRSLHDATELAVQTDAAKKRFQRLFGFNGSVSTVPNAVSLSKEEPSTDWASCRLSRHSDRNLLLCLSRYYPHKNIDIFLPLAQHIKERQLPFTILTTIEEDQHPEAAAFLREIDRRKLDDVIWNLGQVPGEAVPGLYDSVDGLLLPTLLESFSQTYIEAMHYQVPVFTSDLDFARTVCEDAAYYIDPNDPENILEVLNDAFENGEERRAKVDRGKRIAEQNPDWHEVTDRYLSILHNMVRSAE